MPIGKGIVSEELAKEIYVRTDAEPLISTLFGSGDDKYSIIPFWFN